MAGPNESKKEPVFLDPLDRKIIRALQADGRVAFIELAREMGVANATIHSRVSRLKEQGVIKRITAEIDPLCLGLGVSAFIGVKVDHARKIPEVLIKLEKIDAVVGAYFTTGDYSLLCRIIVPAMEDLHLLLTGRVQSIPSITATDTIVVLNTPIERAVAI